MLAWALAGVALVHHSASKAFLAASRTASVGAGAGADNVLLRQSSRGDPDGNAPGEQRRRLGIPYPHSGCRAGRWRCPAIRHGRHPLT